MYRIFKTKIHDAPPLTSTGQDGRCFIKMSIKKTTTLYSINQLIVSVLFGLLLFFQATSSWAMGVTGKYGYVEVRYECYDPSDYQAQLFVDGVYKATFGWQGAPSYTTYKYYPNDISTHWYDVQCKNYDTDPTWRGPEGSVAALAPTSITLSATQGTQANQISLSWTASTGATTYEIYRSTTSGNVGNLVASGLVTSHTDVSISNGYYYYSVIPKAHNVYGSWSNQSTGWRKIPAPASFSATQGTIVNSVDLSWASVTEASGYNIYRSATSGSLGSLLDQTSSTSYTDTTSGYSSAYYYTVKPTYGSIIGDSSAQKAGWGIVPLPDQTTGVAATKGGLYGKVKISWNSANNATSYTLYRSTSSGSLGSQLAANIKGTSYDDTTVSGTTVYYYTVVSVNSTGAGPNSAQVNGWGKVPATPSTLTATQGSVIGKVTLNWTADPDATSYEIYRSATSGGTATLIATVATATYDDPSMTQSTPYYYTVKVNVDSVVGSPSNEAIGWRKLPVISDLSATQGTLTGKVQLSLTADSEATGYEIYRSATPGGTATKIATVAIATYDDSSMTQSTPYYYTVNVKVGSVVGSPGNEAIGWRKLPVISDLSATQGTLKGKVQLSWAADSEATGYEIYRSATSGGTATKIATVATATYDDLSMTQSTPYYYTVKVKVDSVVGSPGNEAIGWRKLPVISDLSATQGTLKGKVQLSWTGTTEAVSYEIWRSITSGSGYALIGSSTTATYEDSTAIDLTTHYYIVKEKISEITVNPSNEATGWSWRPKAITTLKATNGELVKKIRLTWALDIDATHYEIWRADTPTETASLIDTQPATSSSFEDVTAVPDKNYYYTVKVKYNALVGPPSNVALGMAKPIPPAPQVNFKGGFLFAPGKYYVPLGQNVTSLIPTSPDSSGETIKITFTQNGEVYEKTKAFLNGNYPISAPNLGLLEERPITVRVAWKNFPDVYTEKTITAVGGIKNNVKLRADAPTNTSDTEKLVVNLQLGAYTKEGLVYNALTMGQWKTRIIAQTNNNSIYTPVTDWIDMVDGKASFSINPAGNQFMKLMAVSTLITSISDLNQKLESNAKYVQIVKGTPIEGTITSKLFEAPAPKMFTLNLDLTKDNRIALKSPLWEESTDNGATWTPIPDSNTVRKNIVMPEPERKKIRVKMINKNTLIESYTAPVELFTYAKLVATITGPVNGAPSGNIILSADIYKDSFKISNPVVEWTIPYVSGKQFFAAPTVTINEAQEGRLTVSMRARSPDTRADDTNAWAYAKYTVSFKNPLPPVLTVTGPRVIETGKINRYTGTARPSWGGLESALTIISEWELPDGTIVPGKILDWNPTPVSVSSLNPLIYRAWVDGFKQSTISEKPVTYQPWTYIWPEFTIAMKQLSVESPSDVSLIVNHKVPEMDRHFEGLKYTWTFPANVTGRQNDAFPNRASAHILYQGQHDIKVTISDDRGHETVLTQTVTTTEALPFSISMKVSKSNVFDRAPMTITVRPSLSGGHPLDSVNKQTWKVDNAVIDSYLNRDFLFTEIPSPGEHVVSYTMLSKMGKEVIVTKTLTLINNQLPTCDLIVTNSSYSAYVDAKCKDADGKVIAYAWKVDGRVLSSTSYRISFNKESTQQSASVSITATDDAGDLSVPVTITVNY